MAESLALQKKVGANVKNKYYIEIAGIRTEMTTNKKKIYKKFESLKKITKCRLICSDEFGQTVIKA